MGDGGPLSLSARLQGGIQDVKKLIFQLFTNINIQKFWHVCMHTHKQVVRFWNPERVKKKSGYQIRGKKPFFQSFCSSIGIPK